jgi:hypothetical protein
MAAKPLLAQFDTHVVGRFPFPEDDGMVWSNEAKNLIQLLCCDSVRKRTTN